VEHIKAIMGSAETFNFSSYQSYQHTSQNCKMFTKTVSSVNVVKKLATIHRRSDAIFTRKAIF